MPGVDLRPAGARVKCRVALDRISGRPSGVGGLWSSYSLLLFALSPRSGAEAIATGLRHLHQPLEFAAAQHSGLVTFTGDVNIDIGANTAVPNIGCSRADEPFGLRQHATGPTLRSPGSTADAISSNSKLRREYIVTRPPLGACPH